MYCIDYETHAIEDWRPPKPVGVAIKHDDEPGFYLAWGHPTANNSTFETAKSILEDIWASEEELLFQNANFDLGVAEVHMGLPRPGWQRIHDSQFLIYLYAPLKTTSLKPSAERVLGWPPEEQDAVRNWLVSNKIVPANNTKTWGGHICKAPGNLVGEYAIGDVDRTWALYSYLRPVIENKLMYDAYNRERKLAPILARSTKEGVYIALAGLKKDALFYQQYFNKADTRIRQILTQESKEFKIDSGDQLAKAVIAHGYGPPNMDDWPTTPTGKLSTSRETLMAVISHKELRELLAYRGALQTILGTFMESWIELAEGVPGTPYGIIHPKWNQVMGETNGTRTGRISCNHPNFTNVPNDFDKLVVLKGYAPLPQVRKYILADPGQVFVSADFHSQEVRILGHYAEGMIKEIYDKDPSADIHATAAEIINDATGLTITRKETKATAFSILYGSGAAAMAAKLHCSVEAASYIKQTYLTLLTGVSNYINDLKARARQGMPVRTIGGRLVYAPDGKDYVLVNYHVQGSAADQTKEAIIRYDSAKRHGRYLLTVYDEICISVPKEHLADEVRLLKWAMEKQEGLDVPFRATVEVGPNWTEMVKLESA